MRTFRLSRASQVDTEQRAIIQQNDIEKVKSISPAADVAMEVDHTRYLRECSLLAARHKMTALELQSSRIS